MAKALLSLAPVFALIALGWLLKARQVFGAAFWEAAERLTFYFLFPALLIVSIGGADTGGFAMLPMAAALAAATLIVAGVLVGMRPRLAQGGLGGAAFASVLQGATRPNTYVGIAVLVALYGDAGLPLAAVAIVAVIPLVNVLGIVAHLRWARPDFGAAAARPSWGDVAMPTLKNPVIVACLVGAALNWLGIGLPPVVGPTLDIIGRAALPIGLMAVGAGLDLAAAREARAAVLATTAVKLIVMPAATAVACAAFAVDGVSGAAAVIFAALPVSATAYVVSSQMGGDSRLMAGIVAATTIAAAVTLPLVVAVAG